MSGGEIHSNCAGDPDTEVRNPTTGVPTGKGGGVCQGPSSYSVFTLSGGKIYNNGAGEGGGVFQEYGKKTRFIMTGGAVSNNVARLCEGGGIYISSDGEISGGEISYNKSYTTDDLGGGGVYVESHSKLVLKNALITDNSCDGMGGGIAFCVHGNVVMYDNEGAAIYGNTAEGKDVKTTNAVADGQTLWCDNVDFQRRYAQDLFASGGSNNSTSNNDKGSIISGYMYGGGYNIWHGQRIEVSDNKCTEISSYGELMYMQSGILTLTASPTEEAINASKDAAVKIFGNWAALNGGGVAVNGHLTIGAAGEFTKSNETKFRLDVDAVVNLIDDSGEEASIVELKGGEFQFAMADREGNIYTGTNNEDGSITFDFPENYFAGVSPNETKYFTFYQVSGNNDSIYYDKAKYEIGICKRSSSGQIYAVTASGTKNIEYSNVTYYEYEKRVKFYNSLGEAVFPESTSVFVFNNVIRKDASDGITIHALTKLYNDSSEKNEEIILSGGEFRVTVADEDSTLGTFECVADGSIDINIPMDYFNNKETGEYVFVAYEETGEEDITYDNYKFGISVLYTEGGNTCASIVVDGLEVSAEYITYASLDLLSVYEKSVLGQNAVEIVSEIVFDNYVGADNIEGNVTDYKIGLVYLSDKNSANQTFKFELSNDKGEGEIVTMDERDLLSDFYFNIWLDDDIRILQASNESMYTFRRTLKQLPINMDDIVYDGTEYVIEVTINKNDVQEAVELFDTSFMFDSIVYTTEQTYYELKHEEVDGEQIETLIEVPELLFYNYAKIKPIVKFIYDGEEKQLTGGEFGFQLSEGDNVIEAANGDGGNVGFDMRRMNLVKKFIDNPEYSFSLKQTAGEDEEIQYDGTEFVIKAVEKKLQEPEIKEPEIEEGEDFEEENTPESDPEDTRDPDDSDEPNISGEASSMGAAVLFSLSDSKSVGSKVYTYDYYKKDSSSGELQSCDSLIFINIGEPTDEPEPTPTDEPSPSPTDEPEPTPTDEPSPTEELEPTPTDEPDPSPTDEPEPTVTEAPTLSPAPTEEAEPTPMEKPDPSPTEEPEPTVTETPALSPTPTEEPSPSPSSTPTEEPSPSLSPSPTATPVPTLSPSPTPTATPEPTAVEPTPTAEPTVTPELTPTAEPTKEPEITPTATPTPLPSPTLTVTPTPSPSPTATPTPLPSLTATVTPSPIPMATSIPTPAVTPVPTRVPVPTATFTPTPTVTPIPTATSSPTLTPTPMVMPEPTPTVEPTKEPVPTPMVTLEPTPTVEPTKKPDPTSTPVPTKEPELTLTPVPTRKPEPTQTPVPTKEPIMVESDYAYPTYYVGNTPDPNSPDSPDIIVIIDEEGEPLAYIKIPDPENEDLFIYSVDMDIPITTLEHVPETGDSTSIWPFLTFIAGVGIVTVALAGRKKSAGK